MKINTRSHLLSILILKSFFLFGQDTYMRPGVSIINIDFNNSKSNLNTNLIEVPKKLDKLIISKSSFSVKTKAPKKLLPSDIENSSNPFKGLLGESRRRKRKRNNLITESFINNKISNFALLAAVPIGDDGYYNYKLALDRGVNSAADYDVNITSQDMISSDGSLNDRFLYVTEKVLNNNFVIGINMPEFTPYYTFTESGIEGAIHVFVFKIDDIYSDKTGSILYPESEVNNAYIGASLISSKSFAYKSTNSRLDLIKQTKDELKTNLTQLLLNDAWSYILRKVDEFKPISTLKGENKIEIGSKESLTNDNRFRLYENVQLKSGEIKIKRRGTMRVKKVGVNDGIATGNSDPTILYKIGYRKTEEGMLAILDDCRSIGLSYGNGDLTSIRFDYRLKGIFNAGSMMFIELMVGGSKDYTVPNYFYDSGLLSTFLSHTTSPWSKQIESSMILMSTGYERQKYINPAIYYSPFFSIGFSSFYFENNIATTSITDPNTSLTSDYNISWEVNDPIFDSYFGSIGSRLGVQLTSSISLNISLSYSLPFYTKWRNPKIILEGTNGDFSQWGELIDEGLLIDESQYSNLESYYDQILKDRSTFPDGFQHNIMLRLEF